MTAPFALVRDRRLVLAGVIAGLAALFAVTHLVVVRFDAHRHALAAEWAGRGARDLAASPASAVLDFETALSYSPDDDVRLELARALIGARQPAQAEAHLLTLWSEEPGRGDVNLELARVAAARGDLPDAVRYYHAAIDGSWANGARAARRDARLELARRLLAAGQTMRAQAELIALTDDLPADTDFMTDVGSLLLDAGAAARALALFEQALAADPSNARAARLAGTTAYRLANYALAARYLGRAAEAGPLDADARLMLDTSQRVLAIDPFAAGLHGRERLRRGEAALAVARARLDRCRAAASADPAVTAQMADLTARSDQLAHKRRAAAAPNAEPPDSAADVALAIEALPASLCGPDTLDDRALQLAGARARNPAR